MATAPAAVSSPLISQVFNSTAPSIASSPPLRVAAAAPSVRVLPISARRRLAPPLNRGVRGQSCDSGCKPFGAILKTRSNVSCAASMADGQAGDSGKFNLDHIKATLKNFWDQLPVPVKAFPWIHVLENFLQLVIDLTLAVIKYISIPFLAVTAISELAYCAHERKLPLVPVPLIFGFVVGGILTSTVEEVSRLPKDAANPWHLITLAMLFLLLKLPGPYYPYWGRIFIPHFANGGLLRIFWSLYLWNKGRQNNTVPAA